MDRKIGEETETGWWSRSLSKPVTPTLMRALFARILGVRDACQTRLRALRDEHANSSPNFVRHEIATFGERLETPAEIHANSARIYAQQRRLCMHFAATSRH
jgi:hypothetical protein